LKLLEFMSTRATPVRVGRHTEQSLPYAPETLAFLPRLYRVEPTDSRYPNGSKWRDDLCPAWVGSRARTASIRVIIRAEQAPSPPS
jgi:hypothetical protein